MMYLTLKLIHILSAIVLFGLGFGTVFYKVMADRTGDHAAIAITSRHVVLADWWFTTPTVIIQPVTGFLLAGQLSTSMSDSWLGWTVVLYAITGLCWLPVVILQIRMRDLAVDSLAHSLSLPSLYHHYARVWLWLGVPAFFGMIGITTLMVFHRWYFTDGISQLTLELIHVNVANFRRGLADATASYSTTLCNQ